MLLTNAVFFLALGLIWSNGNTFNAILKMGMFGMCVWNLVTYLR